MIKKIFYIGFMALFVAPVCFLIEVTRLSIKWHCLPLSYGTGSPVVFTARCFTQGFREMWGD